MNHVSDVDEVRELFAAIVRDKLPGIELKSLRVSYDEDLSLLLAKNMDQFAKDICRLGSV